MRHVYVVIGRILAGDFWDVSDRGTQDRVRRYRMESGIARLTEFTSMEIAIGCEAAVCGSLGCKPEGSWQVHDAKLRRSDVNRVHGYMRIINCASVRHRESTSPHSGFDGLCWDVYLWLAPQATNHRCSAASRRTHGRSQSMHDVARAFAIGCGSAV